MSLSEQLKQALTLGKILAIEIPATSSDRIAGVIIYPKRYELDKQARTEGWKATIPDRTFYIYLREYDRKHIENDLDIAPGDGVWELKKAEVAGEQALEQLLLDWKIPSENLTYLWKTHIPE